MLTARTISTRPWAVRGLLALVLSLIAGGAAMADSIAGDTVVIQYLYPTAATPFCCNTSGSSNITGIVTAAGLTLVVNNSAQITVFGNDLQMLEVLPPSGSKFEVAAFNGVSIQDLTNPSAFTSFSVDAATTVAGFNASNVSITGGLLFINFQGLTVPLNSLIQVDFPAPGAVPEPNSLVLLATALFVLAGLKLKKVIA